ncbi:hypothetical protein Tco_1037865 [Tanacetum coccineum]
MLHQRMFESGTYKSLPEHIALYEALEASMARAQRDEFLAKKDKSCKRYRDDQDPPPPPPDSDLLRTTDQPLQKPTWVILTSYVPDAKNNRANALATTYQAPTENSLLEKTGYMRTFMNWYCQKMGMTKLTQADLKGQAYEVVKAFYPAVVHLQFQMEECHKMLIDQIDWTNPEGDQVRIDINIPLPLSGPPRHVTVQTQFFFNHDLDYLQYGSKGSGQALSISKMKVARYHDFIPIPQTHSNFNKNILRTKCTLSVVRIKAYSRYGYDYMKEITLRRADHQEYTIAEKDFKNLYPSDFEDLNLMLLQGHLNHLPGLDIRMLSTAVKLWTRNLVIQQWVEDFQLGIESYQKQPNLTKPGWDAKGFEYKRDYTIIDSPRAVVFPVSKNEWKIMRFNEIYKFSDGTLTNIMEALDYRVKEYKVNWLNPGMNTRFWTDKDVERSKDFIQAIERRLKTRRIFQNLECFVGGRVRDIDYRLLQRTE